MLLCSADTSIDQIDKVCLALTSPHDSANQCSRLESSQAEHWHSTDAALEKLGFFSAGGTRSKFRQTQFPT